MKKYYKNISKALEAERPTDKILKVLSNKFAIIQSQYDNGTYEDRATIMGLSKNKCYSYGKSDDKSLTKFTFIIRWIENNVKTKPNVERVGVAYGFHAWSAKNQDNRKYKQQYFKLLKLLNETN